MFKSRLFKFTSGSLVAMLVAMGCGAARAAELGAKDEPIKLAITEWTGQHVTTHIAGASFWRSMGYKVEYVTAGNYPQFSGLADGTLSATLEIWMNNVGDIFPKVLRKGRSRISASSTCKTKEGWVYPKYMTEVCPGLPDWTALTKPGCVQALATPDTLPERPPARLSGRLGIPRGDHRQGQQPALTAVPGGFRRRAGRRTRIRRGRQEAAADDVLGRRITRWPRSTSDWVKMPPCKSQDNEHCINPPEVHKVVWTASRPNGRPPMSS